MNLIHKTESGERRLVRKGGVEPPHPNGHRNLNPARLPIPPLSQAFELIELQPSQVKEKDLFSFVLRS